ncbi:MAG: TraR/DksA C4-type zinc finger protein [Anaerolineales bacterium]|nr:TraR/DksA C4-type zinc finger protein [Anaerolineales bacterium]
MTDTLNLQEMRRELEAQRRQLLAQAGGADWERGRNPDKTALAQSYAQREREVALRDIEQTRLAQIEAALRRLDEGTYGRCTRCGQQIAPGRLRVMPDAPLCITCQTIVNAER